ncbi:MULTISPECIES: hypothetical protein [Fusobacterium]|uniref:hypothetical protein n=1 Tax=Fusobacterium TaxID=848 RepID=UPI001476EC11|nr:MULTISPECIES: hypothetical protein [Fusobacterium]NME35588.1 hypothetical protein [Fusobacterium sp. FSA-380-WT-3A]
MAEKINLVKDGIVKDGFVGFSWTILFFGFLVPLIRKDYKTALGFFLISCVVSYFTYGAGCYALNIIVAFAYNKYYTENLIKEGFKPVNEIGVNILRKNGIDIKE